MKRFQTNTEVKDSTLVFQKNGWNLPPNPRWDVTDFGLGNFKEYEFYAESDECIIVDLSTANDDYHDNFSLTLTWAGFLRLRKMSQFL
jgi:D-lyxose ketol-isomerase